MKLEVNIDKKYFFILLGVLIVIGGIIGVIALGSVPTPGHAISELQTCADGETLKMVGGVWTCATAATSGVTSPACTFCLSCGGNWPSFQGRIIDLAYDTQMARGTSCSGEVKSVWSNPKDLCCK